MSILDFFPPFDSATWVFEERAASAGKRLPIVVTSETTATGRNLSFTYPAGFPHPRCFFDWMTVEANQLVLTHLIFGDQALSPQLPLALTLDDKPNSTADLFPGVPQVGMASGPYHCVAAKKSVSADGKHWTIELVARGKDGTIAYRAEPLEFTVGRGLTKYYGDVYGGVFVYDRKD